MNQKGKLFTRSNIVKGIITLILLGTALVLSSCMSPQERNGVNLLPQNRPSSWEKGRSMGGGMY